MPKVCTYTCIRKGPQDISVFRGSLPDKRLHFSVRESWANTASTSMSAMLCEFVGEMRGRNYGISRNSMHELRIYHFWGPLYRLQYEWTNDICGRIDQLNALVQPARLAGEPRPDGLATGYDGRLKSTKHLQNMHSMLLFNYHDISSKKEIKLVSNFGGLKPSLERQD